MKARWLSRSLGYLPKDVRHSIYRKQLRLPWKPKNNLQFKFVSNSDEFMAAIRILHDCYVQKGFMEKDQLGIRLTPYHLLPNTLMAVAIHDGQVIATMSLIRDNILGLPMDQIFDLSSLRKNGQILCEVSSLAIHPKYRGEGGELLHGFIRFLWRYAFHHFGVDHYVIAVNPSMVELYEAIYLFDRIPADNFVGSYEFVKGAPAVALSLEVQSSYSKIKSVYNQMPLERNLYQYMQNSHWDTDRFPHREYYQVMQSFITPSFIRQLEQIIPDAHARFTDDIKMKIALQWGQKNFADIGASQRHSLRFATSTRTHIHDCKSQTLIPTRVDDVSQHGFKLYLGHNLEVANTPHLLHIPVGPQISCKIVAQPVWKNTSGYAGFQIKSSDSEWDRMIAKMSEPLQDTSTEVELIQINKAA